MPGIIPAAKSLAIDTPPATKEYKIIELLGGIMRPIVDDVQVMAAEKLRSYPSSFIIGINIDPIDEVSATADPDMPAKNMLAKTFTPANPPLILPIIKLLKFTILLAIPPFSIILPIRIKKGIHIRTKLLIPENIL